MKRRVRRLDFARRWQPCFQGQIRANERFDLLPYRGITFNLDVGLHEYAVPPGILATTERLCFVVRTEIAEDASTLRIGGANLRLAMEHAIELVKIDGLRDVSGDYGVILASLGDTIDLDRKNHGDAVFFQLAGKLDRF